MIHKYVLETKERQFVEMPFGAKILSVGEQNGALCLWVMVDPEKPHEDRGIEIIGTGNTTPDGRRNFIGTVVIEPFVWHVFERLE